VYFYKLIVCVVFSYWFPVKLSLLPFDKQIYRSHEWITFSVVVY